MRRTVRIVPGRTDTDPMGLSSRRRSIRPGPSRRRLTNALPALSIVILAAGLVEEDGLFILGGYLMATVTTGYFAFLFLAGKIGLEKIGIHLFSS